LSSPDGFFSNPSLGFDVAQLVSKPRPRRVNVESKPSFGFSPLKS